MKDYIPKLEEKIGFGQIREMIANECINGLALRFVDEMGFSSCYSDIVCNLQPKNLGKSYCSKTVFHRKTFLI